jgi:hypothetical protein
MIKKIYLNINGSLEIKDDSVIRTLSGSGHTARWDLENEMFSIDGGTLKPISIDEIQDENGDPYATFNIFKGAIDPFFVRATGLGGFIDFIYSGDDQGIIIKHELQVGSPSAPKESTFGEGDSYPIPLAFHYDGVSTYMDVTTILESDNGSTTGFFGGITAGSTLMAMSDNSYGSVRIKIDTLGDVNPDNIISEYLDAIGTWRVVNFMSADDTFIYTQSGYNILACSSCVEQINFDPSPIIAFPWGKRTLNINGTDYDGYWSRFRVVSDITLDAVIEQVKLGSNHTKIAADGQILKKGRQRIATYYPIPVVKSVISGSAPSNTDIQWADEITETGTSNTFRDSQADGFMLTGVIPEGFDTSIPFQLKVWYYADAFGGDIELLVDYTQIRLGDPVNGSIPSATLSKIVTINEGDEDKWIEIVFLLNVNKLLAGNRFIVKLHRDGQIGNTNDTLSGSAILAMPAVFGARWKL